MFELSVFLIILPIILYLAVQIYLGRSCYSWPSVPGSLTDSSIRSWTTYSKFPSIQGTGKQAIAVLKYQYVVNGKSYTGKRIKFGMSLAYNTPEELRDDAFLQALQESEFPVYYMRSNPRLSCLKQGVNGDKEHIWGMVAVVIGATSLIGFKSIIDMLSKY